MTDYFALFEQPRRPWLDPEKLEEKYRELARSTHPDESARPEEMGFAEVNNAYRTLRDPKLRLQHLLTLEGKSPLAAASDVPPDLVDLFMKIAPALANNNKEVTDVLSGQLSDYYDEGLDQLSQLDNAWNKDGLLNWKDGEKLYHRFAFLTRWKELLEERQFTLSTETRQEGNVNGGAL